MTDGIKTRLQDEVLRRRGLTRRKAGKLVAVSQADIDDLYTAPPTPFVRNRTNPLLTPQMQILEYKFNKRIEVLLAPHLTLTEVARHLGIDASTVSKWRKTLGIVRTSKYGTSGFGRVPTMESTPDEIDPGQWDIA